MRITDQTMLSSVITDLDQNRQALLQTQGILSSGREVQRPSDDPARAVDAMVARSALDRNSQYQRNVSSGMTWLQTTDTTLTRVSDDLQRARQLVLQASNASVAPGDLMAIAQELSQIVGSVVAAGNSQIDGRYLFGGTQTLAAPLSVTGSPPTAVAYVGDGGSLNREIGPGISASVNVVGSQVFTGWGGALPTLIQAAADVQAGNTAGMAADLQAIDAAADNLTTVRTDVGARLGRLQSASSELTNLDITLTKQLSGAEDADMAKAATRYASLNLSYQAALDAAGRMLPHTLIDFLR